MTLPTILFGFLLACLLGALFHFWRGGSWQRLILYLVLSCLGFAAGHFAGNALGVTWLSVGALRTAAALIGSVVFLLVGYWLSLVQVDAKE